MGVFLFAICRHMRKAAQFPHQTGLFIGAIASLPCTKSVEIRIRVSLFWVFSPFFCILGWFDAPSSEARWKEP